MKRSFASLSPREALQIAIFIEERNAEVYHRFAEMFTQFADEESLEIGAVFWEMAIEERGHSTLLRHKYAERYGNSSWALTEEDLVELIEVPRLDAADILAFQPGGMSGRDRALNVALQAELSAQGYYASLVEKTQDTALREIYRDLSQMEDQHAAYLAAKLSDDDPSEEDSFEDQRIQ